MLPITQEYAADEAVFFRDFSAVFKKLGELGWVGLVDAPVVLPLAPSPPPSRSVEKEGVTVSWQPHSDDTITMTMTSSTTVGWLGLAVSQAGMMIAPSPSKAVIGTLTGVSKHTLRTQNPLSVSLSAPVDAVQDLQAPSFTSDNGKSTLSYRMPKTYFTQWADASGTVEFLYAYGSGAFGFTALLAARSLCPRLAVMLSQRPQHRCTPAVVHWHVQPAFLFLA